MLGLLESCERIGDFALGELRARMERRDCEFWTQSFRTETLYGSFTIDLLQYGRGNMVDLAPPIPSAVFSGRKANARAAKGFTQLFLDPRPYGSGPT